MIQMKCGVYGARDFMKREEDGPFSLSEAEEARLVARGVAEYVDAAEPPADGEPIGFNDTPPDPVEPPAPEKPPAHEEPPEPEETDNNIPAYDVSKSAAELRKIAAEHGVKIKVGMTKAEMVAALDKAFGVSGQTEDTAGEDEEDAPSFDAADAVQ